jgi:uncharacterized lipoprotein
MSVRLVLLVAMTLLCGACSRERSVNCSAGTGYLDAESAALLRVPDDLTVPDQSEAFNIPAPTPPREADEDSAACLEYSPAFSAADSSGD